MRPLNRLLLLTIIFLALSNLIALTTTPIMVQATSKPSVPQFSVQLVNHPYDVPPTTSTHPYTGVVTNTPGYRVDNWTRGYNNKSTLYTLH